MAVVNIFGSLTPSFVDPAAVPYNLGTSFKAIVSGNVVGVRFYKDVTNTGTHVGTLWDLASGTKLGEVTFTGETASGWQEMLFASPIAITANTPYVIAYSTGGHYSTTTHFFQSSGYTNGNLYAYSNVEGVNGRYNADPLAYPATSFLETFYFVDVMFDDGLGSGGVSGSYALTEGAETLSASGAVSIAGSYNITEGVETSSGSGTVLITGSYALVEDSDISSASNASSINGAYSNIEQDEIVSGYGIALDFVLAPTVYKVVSTALRSQIVGNVGLTNLISENGVIKAFLLAASGEVNLPYVRFYHVYGGEPAQSPTRSFDELWVVGAVAFDQPDAMLIDSYLQSILIGKKMTMIGGWVAWAAITKNGEYAKQSQIQGQQVWEIGAYYRIRGVKGT